MSSNPDDRLEELLNAAGRSVQPAHPGWETLPQRLAALPQNLARSRWQMWGGLAAMAAMIFIGMVIAVSFLVPPDVPPGQLPNGGPRVVAAAEVPIVEQKDVELTILSASNQLDTLYMPIVQRIAPQFLPQGQLAVQTLMPPHAGMPVYQQPVTGPTGIALVKDHRIILNLKQGENVVRFTDVAASMDPTSVRFVSNTDPLGTKVVEQNFEYDLASADGLLKRYLDKKITCVDKEGKEVSGYLAAYDNLSIVLASAPSPEATPPVSPPSKGGENAVPRSTETISRVDLQAIRLEEMPQGLLTKPTLVWKIRTETPGKHDTTLSYLCGHIKWQADYVVLVVPGAPGRPDVLDIKGWVTLDNLTGATYHDAGLKLIAGDVNRVRDPWAPPQVVQEQWATETRPTLTPHITVPDATMPKKEFTEKSFFEYHLYSLTAPSTVKDRQIKQLNLLQASGVEAKRRYLYDAMRDGRKLAIQLIAKNEKENQLGMPLPKGKVTFNQYDADGELLFIGSDHIDHTPVKEELTLTYGYAFDVVGEQKEIETQRPNQREQISTMQVIIRNHKDEPIDVRCLGRLYGYSNWEITKFTHPFKKEDFQTISFDLTLKANSEAVIQYTVHYKW